MPSPCSSGWAAVTDSLSWAPVVLFAVIFIWTPPHFWALAVRYKEDYAAADVPMLPVVASMKRTTREIVLYTVLLVAVSLLFGPVAHLGLIYMIAAALLGAGFLFMTVRLWGLARSDRATGARPCGSSATPSPISPCCSSPWRATYSSQITFTSLAVA